MGLQSRLHGYRYNRCADLMESRVLCPVPPPLSLGYLLVRLVGELCGGCNSMRQRLQPYVLEAATLCDGGCNHMLWTLQPYVMEAATICDGRCNLM